MITTFNKVAVIGLGYIGLPTAAILATTDVQVIGVDISKKIIETLQSKKIHIVEPDLDQLVASVVTSGKLLTTLQVQSADAFLITVPTPFKEHFVPDLSYVEAAVHSIAPFLKKGNLIILESTSPVGTTRMISQQLAMARQDLIFPHQSQEPDIHIAYCPERVMPGRILRELVENDRIIGGMTQNCAIRARALYQLFVKGDCILTDSRTAEMSKLTENAFRDVNIAFANELSMICDELGIDVWNLINLANRHPRVNILQPGPGVGGHCIAVDPWFIVNAAPKMAKLIRSAREVNEHKVEYVIKKICDHAQSHTSPKICVLGLSYKANTDDLRESPAVKIAEGIAQHRHFQIRVVEPHISQLPNSLSRNDGIRLMDLSAGLLDADIIVLLVAHDEFKLIDKNAYLGKTFLNIANLESKSPHLMTPIDTRSNPRPVSEYGLMMLNRIYGNFL